MNLGPTRFHAYRSAIRQKRIKWSIQYQHEKQERLNQMVDKTYFCITMKPVLRDHLSLWTTYTHAMNLLPKTTCIETIFLCAIGTLWRQFPLNCVQDQLLTNLTTELLSNSILFISLFSNLPPVGMSQFNVCKLLPQHCSLSGASYKSFKSRNGL